MTPSKRVGTTFRLKLVVLFLFLAAVVLLVWNPARHETSGQVPNMTMQRVAIRASLPPDILIDDFDKTIQHRFLTAPFFGVRRIAPIGPTSPENPHFQSFWPQGEAEISAVGAFTMNSWDVGIFLYGRKVKRRTDTRKERYDIKYRLFDPIPVTHGLKKEDFVDPKALVPEVKQAFVEFAKADSPNRNEVRFDSGRWSYVLRPVRAANQSCLQCHKDYVITERLGDGKFTARKRRIGDPNGVLVYAFKRSNE